MKQPLFKEDATTQPAGPSAGLFDRIITAIAQEQEFKKTKKILSLFILLLVTSLVAMPFSWLFFTEQWRDSGIFYFISTAVANVGAFAALWQDFTLSILESLPVLGIALLALNVALLLFSVRLFLHRKGLLLKYLKHSFV